MSKDSLARSAHFFYLVGYKDFPNPGYLVIVAQGLQGLEMGISTGYSSLFLISVSNAQAKLSLQP